MHEVEERADQSLLSMTIFGWLHFWYIINILLTDIELQLIIIFIPDNIAWKPHFCSLEDKQRILIFSLAGKRE